MLPPRRSEITKVVSAGTNTMVIPLMIPGMLSGSSYFQKCLHTVCTKVSCCVDDIAVDLDQYIVDRQDHKRQEVIDHTEYDRIRSVDDFQCRQMEKMKDAVDDAVFSKQCLPCKRPEQKIHPHWQDEDQHDKAGLIDSPVRIMASG